MIALSCFLACIVIVGCVDFDTWARWNDAVVAWSVKSTTVTPIGEAVEVNGRFVVEVHVEVDYRFGSWLVLFAWLWILRAVAFARGL